MSGPSYIEDRRYYPTGADPDAYDVHAFALEVTYRGHGKWSVGQGRYRPMTHTGRLLFCPLRMTVQRWCRFDFATACALAERHVDSVKVNGRTWHEWEAHFAAQREGAA
jgi:hypothetical protein